MPINYPSIIVDKLALDLDGSRHAYHPNDEGIDKNSSGGISMEEAISNSFALNGNRGYGIAKKLSPDNTHFIGYLQPNGFFVSQTPPYNPKKDEGDPERYADAEVIPYIALSPIWKKRGIKQCDIAYIINQVTQKKSFAIFADWRRNDSATEISLALAKALDIPVASKKVPTYDGKTEVVKYTGIKNQSLEIFYFEGSGDGHGKTVDEINEIGKKYIEETPVSPSHHFNS